MSSNTPVTHLSEPMVPDGSSGEGNTQSPSPHNSKDRIAPRKNHFFTFFLKDSHGSKELDDIIVELKSFAYKGKVQSEICPTTNRRHLQGMVWCKNKHRDTEFKLLKGGHFKTLKDVENRVDYCGKERTWDGVFRASWGFPEEKFIQKIDVFYDWQNEIIKLISGNSDDRSIHWFWEPNGCTGKTTFQKYIFTHFENVVVLSGKACDMKNGIVSYQKESGSLPKIVLVNIPRASLEFVSYTGLEEIKDMFFYSGKYEGGMVCGKPPFLLVFANEEPVYEKMSSDRFIVTKI